MATVFKRKEHRRRKDTKWVARWFDAERQAWRDKTGHADRKASLELGRRLERESALKAEGLISPVDAQRSRPIGEHVTDFIEKLRHAGRNPRYITERHAMLLRVLVGTKAARLADLDATLASRFIHGLSVSAVTKNEYITITRSFTRWALETQRLERDPLITLRRLERRAITRAHPRRALTPNEAGRLLAAAERRPAVELRTIRTGPRTGELGANVSPTALQKADQLGRERRIAYTLALWAGLRRSEIKALAWGDVVLGGAVPGLRLRAETTKAKRGDVLSLHPQLAQALEAHRPADATDTDKVVRTVPDMKAMRADLSHAGIDPGDARLGFVDFHALRLSLGTMMAAAGMSQRARQAHMRHTDPRLTEMTYMDERLLPVASELAKIPPIPLQQICSKDDTL